MGSGFRLKGRRAQNGSGIRAPRESETPDPEFQLSLQGSFEPLNPKPLSP